MEFDVFIIISSSHLKAIFEAFTVLLVQKNKKISSNPEQGGENPRRRCLFFPQATKKNKNRTFRCLLQHTH